MKIARRNSFKENLCFLIVLFRNVLFSLIVLDALLSLSLTLTTR